MDNARKQSELDYMPRRRRGSQYSGYMLRFTQEHAYANVSVLISWICPRGWSSDATGELVIGHTRSRSEHHTQLANMSFDEIFDITGGVV